MSRLIRMDRSGHTTLAEWAAGDEASVRVARRLAPAQREALRVAVGSARSSSRPTA
jgi:hypothetical protein